MTRHRRTTFFTVLLLGGLLAAAGAALASVGMFTAGAAACLLGCFYGEVHFRCPHCGSYMGVSRYQPGRTCRRCGLQVEDSLRLPAKEESTLAAGDAPRP